MAERQALRGMSTVNFWADDLKAAKKWYTEVLGMAPYFERPNAENPAYIEFCLGDYQHELGIIDSKYAPKGPSDGTPSDGSPSGAIILWHVDDINATMAYLLSMGATEYDPITVRGEGFITASVVDPFGNILGIMYNRHYLDILNGTKNR